MYLKELLFVFPLAAALILFVFKQRWLNYLALVLFALIQITVAVLFFIDANAYSISVFPFINEYLRVDSLSALLMLLIAILLTAVVIYTFDFLKSTAKNSHTSFIIFLMLFIMAMDGVLMSTHLGTLWVFIEATTLFSAMLIYHEHNKATLEATWKYIFVCSIGIALAFVGIILLSIANTGLNSLFFDDLYKNAETFKSAPWYTAFLQTTAPVQQTLQSKLAAPHLWLKFAFVFILVGFGTKMGLAPMHSWLPDAHSEAPAPISALLSGALLNTALIGILRVYRALDIAGEGLFVRTLLIVTGIISLIVSAAFMLRVKNYKRMLAYSSIENMGIIALGVGLGGTGIFAAMLHLVAHSLVKTSLFLTSGNIYSQYHSKTIINVRGLLKANPATAWIWLIGFIAIAGMPPFLSFVSEVFVFKAGMDQGMLWLSIVYLGLLTVILFGMGRIILNMLSGNPPEKVEKPTDSALRILPQVILLGFAIFLGCFIPDILKERLNEIVRIIGG